MKSIHIDSGTLGGAALLHGWVKSQLALAALCGQLPQSVGISVTVRAARGSVSLWKLVEVISKHKYQNIYDKQIKHDRLNVRANVAA